MQRPSPRGVEGTILSPANILSSRRVGPSPHRTATAGGVFPGAAVTPLPRTHRATPWSPGFSVNGVRARTGRTQPIGSYALPVMRWWVSDYCGKRKMPRAVFCTLARRTAAFLDKRLQRGVLLRVGSPGQGRLRSFRSPLPADLNQPAFSEPWLSHNLCTVLLNDLFSIRFIF